MSRVIEIVPYRAEWPAEFGDVADGIRSLLGTRALRIDHVGSTSVPGLAAKDIIDVQVMLEALDDDPEPVFAAAGHATFPFRFDRVSDGVDPGQGEKRIVGERSGERPANIHLRVAGRANQRYALLCRDFLRADHSAAQAYSDLKKAAAAVAGNDQDVYYSIKDPAFDLTGSAERWASVVGWGPGPPDA
ncbi:GrpB family protein [bacterium]|nr:GrpB family protein [bacterium]